MQIISEKQIRLSVRNLVEFVLSSGSIDTRITASAQKDAMLLGGKLHRKIQQSMGAEYQSEVYLKTTEDLGGVSLLLEGRADGIFTDTDGLVWIDEIKSMNRDPAYLEAPVPVHRAQALCYARIWIIEQDLPEIGLQMTYIDSRTERIRRFKETLTREAVEAEYLQLLAAFAPWAKYAVDHREQRTASLQGFQFPYPYREGQRRLVVQAYRSIMARQTLFIQAPTGIGKTLSVLFPSAVAMGQQAMDRIFYLTAKTVTRTAAEEGMRILQDQGAGLSFVTITAKDKLCFLDERECNPDACPYAKGHFDRVNNAVYELITGSLAITRDAILTTAKKHLVCPFELCLDTTNWTDVIICDYNYVFDPNVRLQRYFADGQSGDYIFLIDEAHNMVDRSRMMYSAVIDKEDFLEAKKLYPGCPELTPLLSACSRKLVPLKKECKTVQVLSTTAPIEPFLSALEKLYSALQELPDRHPGFTASKETGDFYFRIRNFLLVYELLDDHYKIYIENVEDRLRLHFYCVDPSTQIRQCLEQGAASIFFSATFLPNRYYRELLAGDPDLPAIQAHSPFDTRRRLLAIADDVTTRYAKRGDDMYRRLAGYITTTAAARRGNYLVFMPSYRFLTSVAEVTRLPEGYALQLQETRMTEVQKETFLDAFRRQDQPTIGMCVLGGAFSEGIDLQREALIGVLVIGTGLGAMDTETEILRQYYEEHDRNGFTYACLYPGINRVQQAAGRLIRTAEDTGVILLLDERFFRRDHLELLPQEWSDYRRIRLDTAEEMLTAFWHERDAAHAAANLSKEEQHE